MTKPALRALDRLMSRERDKELDDHDEKSRSSSEPKHADVIIKGDPEAVEDTTHALGLPSPDDLDAMHDDGDDDDDQEAMEDREDHDDGYSLGGPVEPDKHQEHGEHPRSGGGMVASGFASGGEVDADGDHDDNAEFEHGEHPAVRALRHEHPAIHADMKRRGLC